MPRISEMLMPVTSTFWSAPFTSSSWNGLMTAVTSFMRCAPGSGTDSGSASAGGSARSRDPLHHRFSVVVGDLGVLGEVEADDLVLLGDPDAHQGVHHLQDGVGHAEREGDGDDGGEQLLEEQGQATAVEQAGPERAT